MVIVIAIFIYLIGLGVAIGIVSANEKTIPGYEFDGVDFMAMIFWPIALLLFIGYCVGTSLHRKLMMFAITAAILSSCISGTPLCNTYGSKYQPEETRREIKRSTMYNYHSKNIKVKRNHPNP